LKRRKEKFFNDPKDKEVNKERHRSLKYTRQKKYRRELKRPEEILKGKKRKAK